MYYGGTSKVTIIVGLKEPYPEGYENMDPQEKFDRGPKHKTVSRYGWWKIENAKKLARKSGFIGQVTINHHDLYDRTSRRVTVEL